MDISSSRDYIHTSPRTETQLRSSLFAVKQTFVAHDDRLDTIEGDYVSAEAEFSTDDVLIVSNGTERGVEASSLTQTQVTDVVNGFDTGSTDNAVLRADGTGGTTLQNSTVTIDDNGTIVNQVAAHPQNGLEIRDTSGGLVTAFRVNGVGNFQFLAGSGKAFSITLNTLNVLDFTSTLGAQFRNVPVVFNEGGGDHDSRFEGDTLTHMLFLDASASTENIAFVSGSSPNWQSMDRGLFLGDASTIPTGNPSGGVFIYVDSSDGDLYVRNDTGTVTNLSQLIKAETIIESIPFISYREPDDASSILPSSSTATVLGLSTDAFLSGGISVTGGAGNNTRTMKAELHFVLPFNYVDGSDVVVTFDVTRSDAAEVSATLDLQAVDNAAPTVDLVTTAAIDINASATTTAAFTLDGTNLSSGDQIRCLITMALDDTGGSGANFRITNQSLSIDT